MIVNKIFSIKKDNSIVLYNVSFNDEKLYDFLNHYEQLYKRVENVVIETDFVGLKPISYGKYDSMKNICTIQEKGLFETRKEKASIDYFKSLGGSAKEWDFLTEEEKTLFMPIEGAMKGKLKLEVTYPSILCDTIKSTFLPNDFGKCIIDTTNLNKLFNHVFLFSNKFFYDKTIDLKEKKKNWNDSGIAFFSEEDYYNYINKCIRKVNIDDVKISKHETINIFEDIGEILYKLQEFLYCEQIGMFPMDLKLSEELEILKRFGIRNESFSWLEKTLEHAGINYDGGAIINEMRSQIIENYDLDGTKTEEKILKKVNKNKSEINRLINIKENIQDSEEAQITSNTALELRKKIKAA